MLGYEKVIELIGGKYFLVSNDEKVHLEFLLLLNNLSIVNRNCLIFPVVLFVTLFLFTMKISGTIKENDDKASIAAAKMALPNDE